MARRRAGKKSSAPPDAPETSGGKKRASASGGPVGAIFRFLGSLKLAVALLLVWLVVLAGTTFVESARGSEVSQWYVYHSRWFLALMVLFAVNISVAALLRWPWKKRHVGFLIAHAGLLVLGAASIWSFVAGVEGQLTFVEGQAADTIVLSGRSQLTVSRSKGGAPEKLTFAFEPGPTDWPADKPLDFGTVDGLRVKVLRFYRYGRQETQWVESSSAGAVPALRFVLLGVKGTQVADQWLPARKFAGSAAVGPAKFAFHEVPSQLMLQDLLEPPGDELGDKGLLSVYYKDQVKRLSVDENVGKRVSIADDGTEVEIAEYLPNATVGSGGKFNSTGDRPRNPLLELRIHLADAKEPLRQIAFAKTPFLNLDGIHGPPSPVKFLYAHPAVSPQTGMEFFQTPDRKLYCRVFTSGQYQSRGEVAVGDEIEAFAGFKVHLLEHLSRAAEERTFQPAEVKPTGEEKPEAAALFEIAVEGETHEAWLQRASRQHGFKKIQTSEGPIDLSFGYAQRPLGFSLTLLDFERGMNPGGMGDASYASLVQLEDETKGLTLERKISMNQPLTHGKFTFYQSSFQELSGGRDSSVLSAAYDPGRFLKYTGSLMICAGTFVMFYWKRRRRGS